MADTKRRETPDILGSLLGGDVAEPREPAPQAVRKPEVHNTGMPVKQKTRKAGKKTTPPAPPPAPAKEEETSEDKAKATYYLSTEILEALEDGWIQLRRLAPKDERGQISKSLIVELALQVALEELKSKGSQSLLAKKTRKE